MKKESVMYLQDGRFILRLNKQKSKNKSGNIATFEKRKRSFSQRGNAIAKIKREIN
jgi:hypothetical protein